MNKLHYRQPASFWEEALPLGNGRLGAMVYGGVKQERIELNEDTLWSGRPSSESGYTIRENLESVRQLIREGRYSEADAQTNAMTGAHDTQTYQMAGRVVLDFPGLSGECGSYRRELNLADAVAASCFQVGAVEHVRESFVSAPHQVLAVRVAADAAGGVSFRLSMDSQMKFSRRADEGVAVLQGQCPYSNQSRRPDAEEKIVWEKDGVGGIRFVVKASLLLSGGRSRVEGETLRVEDADEAVLLVAVQTGFQGWDQDPDDDVAAMEAACDARLQAATQLGWEKLKTSHVADHAALYQRMALDLQAVDERPTDEILKGCSDPAENTALANLVFNYGRYLIVCASRAGTQPTNLQGVWNNKLIVPWRSNYTININTEMNYWPVETCNLGDCVEPMLTFVRELSASGTRPARELYGARGWCAHHNTDLWRYPYTGGSKAQHAFWPVCGAWLCQHLWEHYRFTCDRSFLEEALPVMKGAAAFLLDFMVRDEGGKWTTSPSTSPENRFIDPSTGEMASVCQGSAMDLTMIRELFENIMEGSSVLGTRDALVDEVEAALAELAMPSIGSDGRLLEFGIEAEEPQPQHRHISHLYGVYPGWMFTPERLPEYFAACRASLDARGDKSTGWAMAWRVAMWARFLDGDRALKVMGELLSYKDADPHSEGNAGGGLYANLWDAHPPFQIDGNYGVTAGICEMLLQSHMDSIDLLPALPSAWAAGRARGIRARGGFEVDLEWADARLVSASIHGVSNPSESCTVRWQGKSTRLDVPKGSTVELPL